MRKLTAALLISTFSCFILTGCSLYPSQDAPQPALNKAVKNYVPTKNSHLMQTISKDIFGDSAKENIILYLQQTDEGMPLSWSLVVNNVEKVKLPTEEGLYFFGEVKLLDLDGDQQEEVLFYRQSSGSAGARGLNVYKTSEQEWRELFAIEKPTEVADKRYQVKYIGDYYAYFEDKKTGLKSTIPLDKNQYIGNENMLSEIASWIDPIADYSVVDHNEDGIQEIVTIQRVIGVAHVDTIGLLKTTYQLEEGYYRAKTITLCDRNDKPLAEVAL